MDYSFAKDILARWPQIFHTLIAGTLSYFGLIVWLRVSGKRTLSKWNSFDFVVTIALGSILASASLTQSVAAGQAMVSVGLLVGFQFVLTWLSVRSGAVQALIKAKPSLLLFKGEFVQAMLKKERVAEGEVLAAVRLNGYSDLSSVAAVVLETDGSFSIIEKIDITAASAMRDVKGFREHALSDKSAVT